MTSAIDDFPHSAKDAGFSLLELLIVLGLMALLLSFALPSLFSKRNWQGNDHYISQLRDTLLAQRQKAISRQKNYQLHFDRHHLYEQGTQDPLFSLPADMHFHNQGKGQFTFFADGTASALTLQFGTDQQVVGGLTISPMTGRVQPWKAPQP